MQSTPVQRSATSHYQPKPGFHPIKELTRQSPCAHRIHFTGEVARETAIAWLHRADVHIVAARFMNSGAVVAESWAAGTPIIQSDAVDPNHAIHGSNGYVFRRGDHHDLAEQMGTAARNRHILQALGRQGYNFAYSFLSYHRLIADYIDIYARVLRRR